MRYQYDVDAMLIKNFGYKSDYMKSLHPMLPGA